MGWLFGWKTRKELVEHLINGNGLKTIKHTSIGTNLWAVQEGKGQDGETIVSAVLYLIQGPAFGKNKDDPNAWGYKDVDETMGPCRIDFPASWLSLLSPIQSPYALEWRAAVKARGDKIATMRLGTHWRLSNGSIYKIVKRNGPSGFIVEIPGGMQWRTTLAIMLRGEKVEGFEQASETTDIRRTA